MSLDDTEVVRIRYNIVLQAGIFKEVCQDWKRMAMTDQTLEIFKRHFANRKRSVVTKSQQHQLQVIPELLLLLTWFKLSLQLPYLI